MLSTSGTYNFNTPPSQVVLDNAFRRIGLQPSLATEQQITAAQEFGNFILQSWPNRGANLWLRRTGMITLIPYQAVYQLPLYTTNVRVVMRRDSIRDLNPDGIPFSSSGGVAANAFDGDPTTACTQTAPNGYISYQWPVFNNIVPLPLAPQYSGAQIINLVGVQSFNANTYTLNFDYSNDGMNWTTVLSAPATTFTAGQLVWFEIPSPMFGFYFRAIETNGATLNIAELYFNNQIIDIPLTGVGEAEYMRYPNKTFPNASAPANFFVDQQINPQIFLYPAPDFYWKTLFFSYNQQIQDMGQMTNCVQIPARFINALSCEIAFYLSMQYAPDKTAVLEKEVERQFILAHTADRERVPMKIYGSYNQGGNV